MRWTSLRFIVFALTCLAIVKFNDTRALAQTAQQAPRVEPRLTVTVETFCSETKLRTSNARIRWSMPRAGLEASGLSSFSAAKQSLETTVYKNGFEKGLLVSVPISRVTPDRPVAALVQEKKPKLRAFQFSLIEVEEPKASIAAESGSEMGAVVEDLEPGVNYTWRIAIDTASGRIVSAPATLQAMVCPADMVPTPGAPKKRKP
jgi:hypothetical protein